MPLMPLLRRGCFAKYILVTFLILFVYSFVVTIWIPRENVGANFVAMSPDANHKMIALAQFSDREESAQNKFKLLADAPESYVTTSQNVNRSAAINANLNSTDLQASIPILVTQRTPTHSNQHLESVKLTTVKPAKPGSSSKATTRPVNATTPFPLGEDNTWNFTVANNPHPFKFLKNASEACASRHVSMLNIIHSKPSNSLHRNIIRKTWGNVTANANLHIATVFVLGQTTDAKIEATVDAENQKYHDIVQEDFLDSYRNLTYKAIAVLRWITNFCPQAEFVLKTDDDVFVNPYDINRLIRRQLLKEPNATKIMCQLSNRNVLREKRFKWYVPEKDYPYKKYPPYCMGTAFIMPKYVIPLLYNASFTTKFFWIDDVYSTGMLAHNAYVSHVNIVKKFVYKANEHRDKLLFGDAAIAHVGGGPNVEKKEKFWEEIVQIELNQT